MTVPSGAVYDRGYRAYGGERGGPNAPLWALFRATIRRALGLRRSWRQKVLPWSLLTIATLPAIVNVGIAYFTRDTPVEDFEFITYREYVGVSTALLLFVAVASPDALCPDRRNRVLPLIFARPLTGAGYVAAKVGALTAIVFGFSFLPQVVLFVGQMLVSDAALDYLVENAEVIWQVPVAVALLAVYYAAVSLALASLTDRRIVGGVALLGVLLVSSTVAGILTATSGGDDGTSIWAVANVLFVPLALRDVVFLGQMDPVDSPLAGVAGGGLAALAVYVAVLGLSLAVLYRRYREVDLG